MEDLLKQLIEIKNKTGLTIKDIAMRANLSTRTIRRWNNGTRNPHPLHIEALERVLKDIINFYKERGIEIEKII